MDDAGMVDAAGGTGGGDPLAPWDGPTVVGLYLVDRRYGGPEEGGWWYDAGPLVEDADAYAELGAMPSAFADHAGARAFMEGLADAVDRMNEGRPETGHSNSRGRYELVDAPGIVLPRWHPEGPAPRWE